MPAWVSWSLKFLVPGPSTEPIPRNNTLTFLLNAEGSAKAPLQEATVHAPATQDSPGSQATLHSLQFRRFVWVSTHRPPQMTSPPGQFVTTHVPPEHPLSSGHSPPHFPQFAFGKLRRKLKTRQV